MGESGQGHSRTCSLDVEGSVHMLTSKGIDGSAQAGMVSVLIHTGPKQDISCGLDEGDVWIFPNGGVKVEKDVCFCQAICVADIFLISCFTISSLIAA